MRPLLIALFLPLFLLAASGEEVRFAYYNVRSYAPLVELGQEKPGKTEESTAAVHRIIETIAPDILAVCEMGSERQFEAFRNRLAAAGLQYRDAEWVEAVDTERHLALLSRYPIVARQSQTDLAFETGGGRQKMRRGILDVTVAVSDNVHVRILGVHLKSKLATKGEESAEIRRQEAHLLRKRVSDILANQPDTRLLVFGDFNDTKDQPAVQAVAGARGAPDALLPLRLADEQGDRWTFYWPAGDVYSRVDFIFVNRLLSKAVRDSGCYIPRTPDWFKASDHRPLVATFRLSE